MMATMTEMPRDQQITHSQRHRHGHVVREGITIGLLGAMAVMLAFFIADLAAGAPLRTPGLLGAALFHGAREAGGAAITMSNVLGYTVFHLLGFIAFGLGVSGLFALAEREKRVLSLVLLLGACLAAGGALTAYFVAQWISEAVPPGVFLAAHILAGVTMVAVLFYFHRRLLREFPAAIE
jgi:hypothetical protein